MILLSKSVKPLHHREKPVLLDKLASNRPMTLPERLNDGRLGTAELMSRHQENGDVVTSKSKTSRKYVIFESLNIYRSYDPTCSFFIGNTCNYLVYCILPFIYFKR